MPGHAFKCTMALGEDWHSHGSHWDMECRKRGGPLAMRGSVCVARGALPAKMRRMEGLHIHEDEYDIASCLPATWMAEDTGSAVL